LKLTIVLYSGEDGFIVAKCPAIPGCVSQGKTEEEAIANIKEAIEGYIKVRKKHGWPLFEKTLEIEVAI